MLGQVTLENFANALLELGHDPAEYRGKKIALESICDVYDLEPDLLADAINDKTLSVHYDINQDKIWLDALEIAHFYYCIKSQLQLFNRSF